ILRVFVITFGRINFVFESRIISANFTVLLICFKKIRRKAVYICIPFGTAPLNNNLYKPFAVSPPLW
ncbi:MAG: hypothetical protein ACLFNM_02230, partial [Candidatus Woesearchaeota archaeon]